MEHHTLSKVCGARQTAALTTVTRPWTAPIIPVGRKALASYPRPQVRKSPRGEGQRRRGKREAEKR